MKILANDGMATSGVIALEAAGFKVDLSKIPQDNLVDYINEHQIEMLLVRSATTARKELPSGHHALIQTVRGSGYTLRS